MNDQTNDKRGRFERELERRLEEARSAIERLSGLSSLSYEWTPADVAASARALRSSVNVMVNAFKSCPEWEERTPEREPEDPRAEFEKEAHRLMWQALTPIMRLNEMADLSREWTPGDISGIVGELELAVSEMWNKFTSHPAWKARGGEKYPGFGRDLDPVDD